MNSTASLPCKTYDGWSYGGMILSTPSIHSRHSRGILGVGPLKGGVAVVRRDGRCPANLRSFSQPWALGVSTSELF